MAYEEITLLNEKCHQMTIAAPEEEGVVFDAGDIEGVIDFRWSLVGSFLTQKPIHMQSMKDTLASLWRPVMGVYIKDIDPNRFIFQFFHERDMQRVLDDGPWTFDNQLLLLKTFCSTDQPESMPLYKADMWVQVHKLPVGFMSEKVAQTIGNFLGAFVKSDPNNFSDIWRSYMRIRVAVDVNKAIKHEMKIKRQGGEWVTLDFKYERLPTVYFVCGLLGHTEKFCKVVYDSPDGTVPRKFDESIRVSMRRSRTVMGSPWLREMPPHRSNLGTMGETPAAMAAEAMAVDKHDLGTSGNYGRHMASGDHDFISNVKIASGSEKGKEIAVDSSDTETNVACLRDEGGVILMDSKRRRMVACPEMTADVNGSENSHVPSAMDSKNITLAGPVQSS
ncbi:hypothetical protein K2173_002710 [Erythroxylum novogranatense]|uniref:DUF4283 domain-containing protein n=1 Tax=Erythroxylum novogranatense TaxID=1862640 RepID=A0AAV8SWT8_9ROSI|nr:hypothetical protein K2173_002710 [Erythroxylum novogranatense]